MQKLTLPKPVDNSDVHQLFLGDQKDRGEGGPQLSWDKTAARDLERRTQVHKLLELGALKTSQDFHDAAFIYQHSLWISAAILDRYLRSIKQPQVFGTQYSSTDNSPYTQDPYSRNLIPDQLHATYCVPSVEQQQKNVAEFNAGRYPEMTLVPKGCTR